MNAILLLAAFAGGLFALFFYLTRHRPATAADVTPETVPAPTPTEGGAVEERFPIEVSEPSTPFVLDTPVLDAEQTSFVATEDSVSVAAPVAEEAPAKKPRKPRAPRKPKTVE